MKGMHLYDYAVIRVVPSVEREEFLNVGLIMFSKATNYIHMQYRVDERKLECFAPEFDLGCMYSNLDAFVKVCDGDSAGGPIAGFDVPERFRWLTAVRSATVQTSRPHAGFSADLDETFERLFEQLVG